MIDRVRLEDFQRHESFDLALSAGITTVSGPSDAGKSSVFRALRWLALNRPRGDGFVRRGAPGCTVKVRADGGTVGRMRNGAENVYWLTRPGERSREYRAFGTDVPEDVRRALGLSEDSFQGQHDPPFWLGLSGPELARRLNAVVDLAAIDAAFSRLESMRRDARTLLEAAERDEAAGREAAAGLTWAVAADRALAGLEAREARLESLRAEAEGLGVLLDELRAAEEAAAARVPDVSRLVGLLAEADELRRAAVSLESLLENARAAEGEALRAEATRKEAEGVLEKETGGTCPLCGGPWKGDVC